MFPIAAWVVANFCQSWAYCPIVRRLHSWPDPISPRHYLSTQIFTLPNLETIGADSNNYPACCRQRSDLQPCFKHWKSPATSSSQVASMPTEIGQITGLQCISIRNTDINGQIPTEIGWLSSLQGFISRAIGLRAGQGLLTRCRGLDLCCNLTGLI